VLNAAQTRPPDLLKGRFRAALSFLELLKDAAGSDRGDIVREIIEIVSEVARGLVGWRPRSLRR